MKERRVKLKINGHVDLKDLREAIDAFTGLLNDLVGHEQPVTWEIRELSSGSLYLECVGQSDTAEGQKRIVDAIGGYERIAASASSGIPLDDYPDYVVERIARITSLIRKGGASSIEMAADGHDWTINSPVKAPSVPSSEQNVIPLQAYVRTSLRGTVSAVNDMTGQVYFTLEEAHTRRKFRCWAPSTWRDTVWQCGRDRRWITVEGKINRSTDPPTLTMVTDIFVHDDYAPGDWQKAVGSIS